LTLQYLGDERFGMPVYRPDQQQVFPPGGNTCHVAALKGTDVDQPRNLAKSVTVE
jgi:hypothetical protein